MISGIDSIPANRYDPHPIGQQVLKLVGTFMKSFPSSLFITILLSICSWFLIAEASQAGILSDVRNDASGASSSWSSDDDDDDDWSDDCDDRSCHHHCDDDPGFFGELLGSMVKGLVHVAFGGLRDDKLEYQFPAFPYEDSNGYQSALPSRMSGDIGYDITKDYGEFLEVGDCEAPTPPINLRCEHLRRFAIRFDSEYGTDTARLSRIGSHLLLSTTQGLGIETEFSYFIEKQPGDEDDSLWLGDVNLVYRFLETENTQWRWGVGVNWLTSQGISEAGFNFTMSADFYLGRPWVISTGFDVGAIGETDFFQYRVTAGINLNRFEAYTGYQYYDIGTSQMNFLIGGVRIWY